MNHALVAAAAAIVIVALGGCSSRNPDPAAPPVADSSTPVATASAPSSADSPASEDPSTTPPAKKVAATELAEKIAAKVKSATKIVGITEDNDPNDLIGRPNGYVDGAVIYDSAMACDSLGVACGATIEVWPSAEEAQSRADYIQQALKDNRHLGTEYHTIRGPVLFRVTGDIKPSIAKQYAAAFTAATP